MKEKTKKIPPSSLRSSSSTKIMCEFLFLPMSEIVLCNPFFKRSMFYKKNFKENRVKLHFTRKKYQITSKTS